MPKRILIADDTRDSVRLIRNLLELSGYEVEDVASGAAALRRVSESDFDLLLLDFDMRDIKGDRICLMLSAEERYKELPIVIITAHIEKDEKTFRDYGALDVIYKPFDTEEFMKKIKKYLKEV